MPDQGLRVTAPQTRIWPALCQEGVASASNQSAGKTLGVILEASGLTMMGMFETKQLWLGPACVRCNAPAVAWCGSEYAL